MVIDLTDRHLAQSALQETEDRFRRIADSAPVPMWVTSLDRKRQFANIAYCEFLGVSYEEALAFDWRTVLHPDDAPRIYAEQVAKEAALQPFSLEARYRRATASGAGCAPNRSPAGVQRRARRLHRRRLRRHGGQAGAGGPATNERAARNAGGGANGRAAGALSQSARAAHSQTLRVSDQRLRSWLEFMGTTIEAR
jgi:PAS domain S-box-containing protein